MKPLRSVGGPVKNVMGDYAKTIIALRQRNINIQRHCKIAQMALVCSVFQSINFNCIAQGMIAAAPDNTPCKMRRIGSLRFKKWR
ncbi:MAG: hypothetical protein FWD36_05410 [Treponema sp.]|nr:hypothetical protein [Treponema sp.]